ncbi:hypothetical protein DFJ73DRAFT_859139 [Zopfochytrium polystomum]|nr:hypothetical protein DFJ73DRAFT_859139 [Zopfochytrium polystomum]
MFAPQMVVPSMDTFNQSNSSLLDPTPSPSPTDFLVNPMDPNGEGVSSGIGTNGIGTSALITSRPSASSTVESSASTTVVGQSSQSLSNTLSPSPTSTASSVPNGNSVGSAVCPLPFMINPNPITINSRCVGNGTCCLPCPSAFFVETPGFMDKIFKYDYTTVTIVSSVSAVIVLFSLLLIPAANRHASMRLSPSPNLPRSQTSSSSDSANRGVLSRDGAPFGSWTSVTTNILSNGRAFVVCMNVAIVVEIAAVFMSVFNPKSTICDGDFDSGNQGNNSRCFLQGVVFIFGVHLVSLSMASILLNLHLTVVWKNKFFERNYGWVISVILLVAIGLTVVPAVMNNIIGLPGFICSVDPARMIRYLYLPQVPFVLVPFILQVITLIYSIVRGRKSISRLDETRHNVRREIRAQWRAVILSILFQISWIALFLAFLQFRLTAEAVTTPGQLSPTTQGSWVRQWFLCLLSHAQAGDGQAQCAPIVTANTPSIPTIATLLSLHLLMGLYSVFVFVLTNPPVLREWRIFLFPKSAREKNHGNCLDGSPGGPAGEEDDEDWDEDYDGEESVGSESRGTSVAEMGGVFTGPPSLPHGSGNSHMR